MQKKMSKYSEFTKSENVKKEEQTVEDSPPARNEYKNKNINNIDH